MLGSQLLQIIKTLNKRDMRELHKVVRSPYFNQREDVINLFNAIEKSLNNKLPDLSKEKIFKDLYPNKKYDDVLMRQIMSYLYKIIQKYLITEGVLENEIESQLYLSYALRQRHADKILEKQLIESLQIIDKQEIAIQKNEFLDKKTVEYFVNTGTVMNEAYTNRGTIKILSKDGQLNELSKASDNYNISALTETVTKYFISSMD